MQHREEPSLPAFIPPSVRKGEGYTKLSYPPNGEEELALGFVFSFSFQGKADIALLLFALIYEACAELRGALDPSFSPWMGNDRDQEGGRNELLC